MSSNITVINGGSFKLSGGGKISAKKVIQYRNWNHSKSVLRTSPEQTSAWFGRTISMSGDKLAVGAEYDDGVNNTTSGTGAVYTFKY